MNVQMIFRLVTDYGEVPAPPDLVALYEAAPKVKTWRTEEGHRYQIQVVDERTEAGKAYYARERELVSALTIVQAAGYEVTR